jgi:NAD-dependent deacetylase
LADLERLGILKATITQNIDGLDLLAGSNRVIEIHGNFRNATCIGCYETSAGQDMIEYLMEHEGVPTCQACGGTLKPNVILFGEQLPFSELQASHEETSRCDVMLVAGSSLIIEPAASLPKLARQHGARLIFVNLEPTWLDDVAEVVIHADVAQVLPEIVDGLSESNDKSR